MAVKTPSPAGRSDVVRALPTYKQAAEIVDIHPAGITRAVERLGITPVRWGGKEKHLQIDDVMRIARHADRASLEEIAGGLIELAERQQPDQVDYVTTAVDRFFEALPAPTPKDPDVFIAGLHANLPPKWAKRAEALYRLNSPAPGKQES